MKKLVTFDNSFLPDYDILAKTPREEWWQLSRFPAKMILVHERAILIIDEISFS